MPNIYIWDKYISQFQEGIDDDPTQHLIEFHGCIHKIGIYHEEVLIKLFMMSM